jgi:hypothetical protein
VSFLRLLVLYATKDCLAINILAALADDGVADLTDEDNKACRGIVVRRVGPNHENHVHDWDEEVWNLSELLAQVCELVEQSSKGLKILKVLVGLRAGSLDLFLKLAEGTSVSRFVLLEELKNLLDALRVELIANCIKVLGFVLPKLDLSQRIGVLVTLKGALWVLLKNIFNLFGPGDDCA